MLDNSSRIFMMPEVFLAWIFAFAVAIAAAVAITGLVVHRHYRGTASENEKAARTSRDGREEDQAA